MEESGLGRVAIAAELGVGVVTVTSWRRRFGWVWAPHRRGGRAPAVAGVPWPKLSRRAGHGRDGQGREHPPATVALVRRLFEEGALTRAAIATRTGVGIMSIRRWAAQKAWRHPPRWEVVARFGHPPRASLGAIASQVSRTAPVSQFAALEAGCATGAAPLDAAFATLRGAVAMIQRPVPPGMADAARLRAG